MEEIAVCVCGGGGGGWVKGGVDGIREETAGLKR